MSIYTFKVKKTDQTEVLLENYKGKVLLIVNTATACGFTPQYEGLESLYRTYKDQEFEILDFPCNQFMNQAKGTDQQLSEYCKINFGTSFETFAKVEVNGEKADPLFQYLRKQQPEAYSLKQKKCFLKKICGFCRKTSDSIQWNFTKFLIDRNGKVLYRFSPNTKPEEIITFIDQII